jgi:hypothetical protein
MFSAGSHLWHPPFLHELKVKTAGSPARQFSDSQFARNQVEHARSEARESAPWRRPRTFKSGLPA